LIPLAQKSYRGKQLHDLLYKSRAKQIEDFNHGGWGAAPGAFIFFMQATCLLFCFSQPTNW
jgi:hypothetical protein